MYVRRFVSGVEQNIKRQTKTHDFLRMNSVINSNLCTNWQLTKQTLFLEPSKNLSCKCPVHYTFTQTNTHYLKGYPHHEFFVFILLQEIKSAKVGIIQLMLMFHFFCRNIFSCSCCHAKKSDFLLYYVKQLKNLLKRIFLCNLRFEGLNKLSLLCFVIFLVLYFYQ